MPSHQKRRRIPIHCVHLGEILERQNCACAAKHVRACALHGRTTIRDCYGCDDFTHKDDAEIGSVRNLLYHVYPIRGNGTWQRNLDQLAARLPLFNGQRTIAIAHDGRCDDPQEVKDYLAAHDRITWIVMPNEARLREVKTWHALWETVEHCGPDCTTFYAHAKGVTKPVNPGVTCHPWATMMYEINLDYWPLVIRALRKHPMAGAFLKSGPGFGGSLSIFHYSGAFYWVRHRDLGDKWKRLDLHWWGVESWPGLHFTPAEVACLFHSGVVPTLHLYRMPYFKGVQQEYETWKSERVNLRSVIG